jgi:hypothetical protein
MIPYNPIFENKAMDEEKTVGLEMFWFEYEQKKISVCNNSHFFTAEGET